MSEGESFAASKRKKNSRLAREATDEILVKGGKNGQIQMDKNEEEGASSVRVLPAGNMALTSNDKSSRLLPEDALASDLPQLPHNRDRELSSETFSTRPIYDSTPTINLETGFSAGSPSQDESSAAAAEELSVEILHYRNGQAAKHGENQSQSVSAQTIKCSNTKDKEPVEDQNNLNRLKRFRVACGMIVNHHIVQNSIILLICLNALTMGIATLDVVEDNEDVRQGFETLDMAFLVIFTVELAMQFIYHGQKLFLNGWLVFDFFVVVMSWSFESLQIVRAFRIFRALRLIARLQSLKSVISSLAQAAPSLGAVTFILVLVLYIFAVLCTELFSETVLDDDYFTRLDQSLFTLLEMMTLEWADVARQVLRQHSWAWAVFVPFLVITNFALFSLVVAVVCDGVTVTEHGEPEDPAITHQRMTDLRKQVHTLTKQQDVIVKALRQALQELEDTRGKDDREVPTQPKP